jgi:hypothetical protein
MKPRLQTFWWVIMLLVACTNNVKQGPYSLDEAVDAELPLPLYYPDPQADAQYAHLGVTYYYFDWGDDLRLDAYFTVMGQDEQVVRVARMAICITCGLIGPPNEATGRQVLIDWADEGKGYTCRILSDATRNEFISGDAYKTCLVWGDEQGYRYKLYTVWSEDETVSFINSLLVNNDKPTDVPH